jgi:hypothetical protein
VPRVVKPFFILVAHGLLRVMVTPKLSPLGEVESGAMWCVATPEPSLAGKQGLELRDT